MEITAVLFDWRGTLVVHPDVASWVGDALRRVGRDDGADGVAEIAARIEQANGSADRMDAPGLDADAARHRAAFMGVFADAGLDTELAEALYASESDPARNVFAADAVRTVRALKAGGLAVGVVSDIHFDIRPAFAAVGLGRSIDSYSLSFEVGAQKPDQAIYHHALHGLGRPADQVLMVGDRAAPDGRAVEHGIPSLLLPPLRSPQDERLSLVLTLAAP